jgi:hypothetical protein
MDEIKGELGHGWPMSPFTFTSIGYLKIKRDLGALGESRAKVAPSGQRQPLFGCRRQRDKR